MMSQCCNATQSEGRSEILAAVGCLLTSDIYFVPLLESNNDCASPILVGNALKVAQFLPFRRFFSMFQCNSCCSDLIIREKYAVFYTVIKVISPSNSRYTGVWCYTLLFIQIAYVM